MADQTASYSLGEEIANSVTHGVAAIFSVVGLILMVTLAALRSQSAVAVTAVAIFGASMIVLYTASTLYHAITNRKAKKILQVFDHSSIYLLIAGSYTPFCLITLQGTLAMGWLVLLVIKPLVAALPAGGLWLLVAGGLAYSVGVFFYVMNRIPFNHAIWHVFVFAGTLLQFLSVFFYVLPASFAAA